MELFILLFYQQKNYIQFWSTTIIISDQQISMLLRRDLVFAFENFAKTLAVTCNFSTNVVASPIKVNNHN